MLKLKANNITIKVRKVRHHRSIKDTKDYYDGNVFEFRIYEDGILDEHNSYDLGEMFGMLLLKVFAYNANDVTKKAIMDFLNDPDYEEDGVEV